MRVGIDVGGTFTDVILATGEAILTVKVPTTHRDPGTGVMSGITRLFEEFNILPEEIKFIGHGSTVATNLLIEGTGAETGLITTKGFRDILEHRRTFRHDRADLYDMQFINSEPLVSRYRRLEISERCSASGEALVDPSLDEVAESIKKLEQDGVESLAICFLHSYVNPTHEQKIAKWIKTHYPHMYISISSEVDPAMFEYERFSTTVVNAYLGPKTSRYIATLDNKMTDIGISTKFYMMQSNGGLSSPNGSITRPVRLLNSGPAGGVTASRYIAGLLGFRNVITADMGGTSFDVSIISNGDFSMVSQQSVNNYDVRYPTVDIVSVGAGGGSIVQVDESGVLQVGPESAGSEPGPACYSRGGTYCTVTDANLVLGILNENTFLGGTMALDKDLAKASVQKYVADPLGIGIEEASEGIFRVVNAKMSQLIRLCTIERGQDPRDFILMAYGGAGGGHACELAEDLSINTVVIPPFPGLQSALGMVLADYIEDIKRPILKRVTALSPEIVLGTLDDMEKEGRKVLSYNGFAPERIVVSYAAEMKYDGQLHSLSVPINIKMLQNDIDQIRHSFMEGHQKIYGFGMDPSLVFVENIWVQCRGVFTEKKIPRINRAGDQPMRTHHEQVRSIRYREKTINFYVYMPEEIGEGMIAKGPAIVEKPDSTVLIPPMWEAIEDIYGDLIITRK